MFHQTASLTGNQRIRFIRNMAHIGAWLMMLSGIALFIAGSTDNHRLIWPLTETPILFPSVSLALLASGIALLGIVRKWSQPVIITALLCFTVLMLDIATPRGVAMGFAYVPLIFCSIWFARFRTTFLLAFIASLLTIIAVFLKEPSTVDNWMVLFNRFLSIAMLWATAALIQQQHRHKGLFEQNESRLRAVVDHALDGLISLNARGLIEHFNPACERIFGYKAQEVIGKNIKMLMPEPYHSHHDGYLSRYLATGEAHIIGTAGREVAAKRKDGSVFPIDLSISVFHLEDGKHFSGIIRDITQRKEAEQQINDSASRLKAVFDTVLDGLITIDSHATIQSFNKAAERIFGYSAEEVTGQNVKMLMPEPYHSEHDRYVQNYQETGIKKIIGIGREVAARRKDGTIFPMELGISEFAVGKERAFVGIIRDISQRKETEKHMLRYTHDLERSNQELDDFAYIASHDLKEPLRGLFNNAKFLLQDYQDKLDADGVKRLQRLGYLCQRMEMLVNDLLYFSRIGRQELAIQLTDLNLVVRDIESMIETTLKEHNVRILIPRPLPSIIADKPRTTELLRNLITNAIKYNDKQQKTVEVGYVEQMQTSQGVEPLVFYVRDNGIGIEREFYEEIFRIFKRLNEEDDDKKGTGVGLTFVRKIVERHGGRIWLESEPGHGTVFYFTLQQGVDHETTV